MRRISIRTASAGRADPRRCLLACVLLALVIVPVRSAAGELAGYAAGELWSFPRQPLHAGQESSDLSVALQPEYYQESDNGSIFTIVPFLRYDRADPDRTHADLREMNYLFVAPGFELRAGVGKVFWGATEFVHLVDIVNQTDLVENPDGEDKLGQPMVQLIKPFTIGTLEVFVLPYFRERTFPGPRGRFRSSLPVSPDVRYEHPDGERHPDYACRFSGTFGIIDLGLSYFQGTGREPTLLPAFDPGGSLVLMPLYEQIGQAGLDVQAAAGELLVKIEALRRSGQGEPYYASAGGMEYTVGGIFGSSADLGVLAEFAYDTRQADATTPFERDLMLGLRLALNDFPGTELLLGVITDINYGSQVLRMEGSRRLGNRMKLFVEAGAFLVNDQRDLLYDLRNDDYLSITSSFYF